MDTSSPPTAAPPSPGSQVLCQDPSDSAAKGTDFTKNPNSDERQNRAIAQFREFVMQMAAKDSARPLTAARKSLIEQRFREIFTDVHTPDHPPYASMIHMAINELNEKGGSTEEAISEFIKNQYHDLPWAHSTFLKHHLQKLCESSEIVVGYGNRYLLGGVITEQFTMARTERKGPKRKPRKQRGRARKTDLIQEKNQQKGGEMGIIALETQVIKEQYTGTEEQKQPQEKCNHVIAGTTLPFDQRIEVIEELHGSPEQRSRVSTEEGQQEEEIKVGKEQNEKVYQENKVIDEENEAVGQQKQNEQEKPQKGPLLMRFRLSKPEPTSITKMVGPLPLNYQQEEQQEKDRNGLEGLVETLTAGKSSMADQQHQNEQQQPVQRGRRKQQQPKSSSNQSSAGIDLESSQKQQQSNGRGRGRGRGRSRGRGHGHGQSQMLDFGIQEP